MTGRVPGSGSTEPVLVSEAPEAAEVLAAEPAPRFLQADEAWVCRFLIVGILGVVPATVGVHDSSQSVFVGRAGRKAADPAGLGCIRLPHAASMEAGHQTPVAADGAEGSMCEAGMIAVNGRYARFLWASPE
jgi:hypothetical protein